MFVSICFGQSVAAIYAKYQNANMLLNYNFSQIVASGGIQVKLCEKLLGPC